MNLTTEQAGYLQKFSENLSKEYQLYRVTLNTVTHYLAINPKEANLTYALLSVIGTEEVKELEVVQLSNVSRTPFVGLITF